jgi:hypothetical protein
MIQLRKHLCLNCDASDAFRRDAEPANSAWHRSRRRRKVFDPSELLIRRGNCRPGAKVIKLFFLRHLPCIITIKCSLLCVWVSGSNVIKLFMTVFAIAHNKPVFVPGMPFQSNKMFELGWNLPEWSISQVLRSRVGSWPYPQTLDFTGYACKGQTLAYYKHL